MTTSRGDLLAKELHGSIVRRQRAPEGLLEEPARLCFRDDGDQHQTPSDAT